jgi:hypothetical protein
LPDYNPSDLCGSNHCRPSSEIAGPADRIMDDEADHPGFSLAQQADVGACVKQPAHLPPVDGERNPDAAVADITRERSTTGVNALILAVAERAKDHEGVPEIGSFGSDLEDVLDQATGIGGSSDPHVECGRCSRASLAAEVVAASRIARLKYFVASSTRSNADATAPKYKAGTLLARTASRSSNQLCLS